MGKAKEKRETLGLDVCLCSAWREKRAENIEAKTDIREIFSIHFCPRRTKTKAHLFGSWERSACLNGVESHVAQV